jgi:hypothetical protein
VKPNPRLIVVIGALLVSSACGLDEREQTAADSLENAWLAGHPSDYEDAITGCVMDKWVGEAGVDALVEDGVLSKKLRTDRLRMTGFANGTDPVSPDTATAWARAYVACQDWDVYAQDLRAREQPKASEDKVDDVADCFKDIPRDTQRQAAADTATGHQRSAAIQTVTSRAKACTALLG